LIRGDGRIVASGVANAISNKSGGEIRAESGKSCSSSETTVQISGQINCKAARLNSASH